VRLTYQPFFQEKPPEKMGLGHTQGNAANLFAPRVAQIWHSVRLTYQPFFQEKPPEKMGLGHTKKQCIK
jgi:hypothetical protein